MDYVDRIKALREDKDLKQREVAKILNKSQQGYAHLENRKAKFTVEDIIKLCDFYNVTADYILGLTDQPKPCRKKECNENEWNRNGNYNNVSSYIDNSYRGSKKYNK